MTALAFVFLATVGTLVRASASGLNPSIRRRLVATLMVNIAGSFLLGLLGGAGMDVRVAAGVGGLGAMTTFSTFAELVDRLARETGPRNTVLYVMIMLVAGIGAAWLGLTLG